MSITGFPVYRPRRTRATENLRAMIRETEVSVKDLIYPLFVVPGENVKHEIESLPGNYHWSIDRVMECVDEVVELGIPAVLLFGVPSYKDAVGSSGWDMNEPVQQACKLIRKNIPSWLSLPTSACANTPSMVIAACCKTAAPSTTMKLCRCWLRLLFPTLRPVLT